jgi:phosphoglycolate phosphatase-like HAD superfamily hydrolase
MDKERDMSKIVVFDIDGTLANIEHRRHWVATKPKNWGAFNAGMAKDTLHADVAELAILLHTQGNTILLCSGRGEETRAVTEAWLAEQVIAAGADESGLSDTTGYANPAQIRRLFKR